MAILETQTVIGDVSTTSKTVRILASSQVWNGTDVTPATLTFSGEAIDLSEAMTLTIVGLKEGETSGTALPLTATGSSIQTDANTVTSVAPHTGVTGEVTTSDLETGEYIRVIATLTPSASDGLSEDVITTVRLGSDGKSSYQVVLTNESHTVPSNHGRTFHDFTDSGTTISAYYGVDQLAFTTNATPSFGEFSVGTVTATGGIASGAGNNTVTVSGNNASLEEVEGWTGSVDVGTRSFNIIMKGTVIDPSTTYTKQQSLTRSLEGDQGVQGDQGIQGIQGIQGVAGEKGERGAGRFSKTISRDAPEVGSRQFNNDAMAALIDALGSDGSTPTSTVTGEFYRIASVVAVDWSSVGGPASAVQGDVFIGTATNNDISALGTVENVTSAAPEKGDVATITYLTSGAPSTSLNGNITAGSYSSVVVPSTDGFPDKGRITINATDVFIYTSRTSTSFIGNTQTLSTLPTGSPVVSNTDIVTRVAIHDGTGIADDDWETFALTIDGSLLVNGTVVSDSIATGAVSANKIEVDGHIRITSESGGISGGVTDTSWDNDATSATMNDVLSDNDNDGATSLGAVGDGFWIGNTPEGGRAFIGKAVEGEDASYMKFNGDQLLITGASLVDAQGVAITSGSGLSSAAVHLYQRVSAGSTAPSLLPTVEAYFQFSNGKWYNLASGGTEVTDFGNNWSSTIPSGSGDLYLISSATSSKQARDVVGTSEWDNIRLFSEVGEGGFNSAPVFCYRRVTAGDPAPTTTPSANRFYEFSTGDWYAASSGGSALHTTIGNDWFTSIPTGEGDVYVMSSTASSVNLRDEVSSVDWSNIRLLAAKGNSGTNGVDGSPGDNGTNGVDGKSIAQVMVFKRSATAPSDPTGGSYNFTNNTLSAPSGWSSDVPAGTDPVYSSVGTSESTVGGGGTSQSVNWGSASKISENGESGTNGTDGTNGADGDAGADGTNGLSTFTGSIYRRSASTPATPTGGSYNFGTNTLTAPPDWSNEVPAGTDPLYVSTDTFSVTGNTGTDSTTSWSTPVIMVQDGTDGDDGAPGSDGTNGTNGTNGIDGLSTYLTSVFKRSASQPATPAGGSFNFGTNSLTAPSGWSTTVPDTDGNSLWTTTSLASVSGDTGTDSTLTWVAPTRIASDGADGPAGTNTAGVPVYKKSASEPISTDKPNGDLTYTFSTGVLSGSNFNGWSETPPTLVAGETSYVRIATATGTGTTDTVATGDWSAALLYSSIGADGADGTNGTNGTDGTDGDDGAPGSDGTNGTNGSDGANTAVVYAYRKSNTVLTTEKPSTTRTWTFSSASWNSDDLGNSFNGKISGAGTGSKLYVCSAVATGTGTTDTVAAGDWSNPQLVSEDGADGTNGTNGTNGTDGDDGAPGSDGTNGTNGVDGADGADAASWSASNTYAVGDVVSFGAGSTSKLYLCVVGHGATSSNPTANTSKWDEFVGVRSVSNGLVQTASVQLNAITVPSSAYTSGGVNLPKTANAVTQIQSLTVTTSGSPVSLLYSASISGSFVFINNGYTGFEYYGDVRIYRDGSILETYYKMIGHYCFGFVDNPPAGTHTYTMDIKTINWRYWGYTPAAKKRFISATEIKR